LNGIIDNGATSAHWSASGSGAFSPDAQSLNAVYTITNSDIALGQVTFILSADAEGACASVNDTVVYSITNQMIVNAGSDLTICSNDLTVPLAGNVNGEFENAQWTSLGSGLFNPSSSNLNTSYLPGDNDLLNGEVLLVLTSNGNGVCASASDTLLVTINSPAVVNAGADQVRCNNDAEVILNGVVSGGTLTGIWTTTGSGSFVPNNTSMNASYFPSANDILNGAVVLTLTSSGNGACDAVADELSIQYIQAAVVNAGQDVVLCGAANLVELYGSIVSTSASGVWSTNGTGNFSGANTSLVNGYTLSANDVQLGEVTLVLTSTLNNLCGAQSDTLIVTIEELPVAAFSAVSGESLDVQFIDESLGAVSWLWDFGVGGSSTSQDPSVLYPSVGIYEVTLVIQSAGGCFDTTSANVEALDPIGTPVAIPSGFSPNGDQSNDVLHVLGGPFKEVDFRIYNEWGNLVYSTTDPLGGWDGTYKGESQPGGVYVYTATGTTVKGRFVRLSGNVTLIR